MCLFSHYLVMYHQDMVQLLLHGLLTSEVDNNTTKYTENIISVQCTVLGQIQLLDKMQVPGLPCMD